MKLPRWLISLVLASGFSGITPAGASEPLPGDAAIWRNYMLHCMGCHGPTGERIPGKVPPLHQTLGWYMQSQAGREFSIKVPGVSNSALSDEEVAQVMNLLLRRYNASELPRDFQPYTEAEITRIRKPALADVKTERVKVVAELQKMGVPIPSDY